MSEQNPVPFSGEGARISDEDPLAGDPDAMRIELAALRGKVDAYERDLALAAERERQLRNEAQRRVRNLLAMIRSIFSRTLGLDPSFQDLGDHFRGRLDALARFQVTRRADSMGSIDLEEMIRDELRSFEFDPRIEIAGPEVAVPNDAGQLLGLAIHELTTNAIKFGALATSGGPTRLRIRWIYADGALDLNWEETGVAVLASAPVRIGFGREYIEQALPYQAAATTSFELRPGGLLCTIAITFRQAMAASSARNWL